MESGCFCWEGEGIVILCTSLQSPLDAALGDSPSSEKLLFPPQKYMELSESAALFIFVRLFFVNHDLLFAELNREVNVSSEAQNPVR